MVSPMPLGEQGGDAGGGLERPDRRGPGLGHTEMERVIGDVGQLAVGLDHQGNARRLDRDLDHIEADLVEVGQLATSRLDHRLGGDLPPYVVEVGIERARVDPDADRHLAVLGLTGDGLDVVGPA